MQHLAKRARLLEPLIPKASTRCFATAPESKATKKSTKPSGPPYLPRPLGVQDPPHVYLDSKKEPKSQIWDPAERKAKRREITKELSKSYFQDLSQLSQTGGKLWIAPETVIRADKALYFPVVEGISLANKEKKNTAYLLEGKVSLVAVLNTQISVEHVNSFIPTIAKDQASEPLFQIVNINKQDNMLKSWLVSMYLSSLRKTVPEEQHANYLLTSQNIDVLKEPMGMLNKHVGYLYLVDWQNRIRWAGVGFAEEGGKELAGLRTCVSVLIDRLKKGVEP